MNRENEIEAKLVELRAKYSAIKKQISSLEQELDSIRSKKFIEVNRIHRSEVFSVQEDAKKWIGVFWNIANYLREHGIVKRYVEWNGKLYHYADVMSGKSGGDSPGFFSDVLKG